MDPAIEADFLNHPARDLPAAYVHDWYFAAFAADLGYSQMGWILPRVLQLLADGEEVTNLGLEVVLARLPVAGFPDGWPPEAVEVVSRFAHAWIATRIEEGTTEIDAHLCMIGESGLPIGPLLADVAALADAELAALLHRSWVKGRAGSIGFSAFWSQEPARSEVWAWYTSTGLEARMRRAGETGDPKAAAVAEVIPRAR